MKMIKLPVFTTTSLLASFSVEIDHEATQLHELIANQLIALHHVFQCLQFKTYAM